MNVYLDTSAVIKLYYREVGSEELLAFLRRYAENLIITMADITRTEFHSAFLRRVRTGDIPIKAAYRVFEAFDNDLKMFNVIVVDDIIKHLAVLLFDQIAHQKSLRTLDSFQLATALFFHRLMLVDYFISSDQKFLNVAQDYFTTFNPEN